MTQGRLVVDFINWGINVAFIVTVVFPIGIRPIWNWPSHPWGWNTVTFDVVVALALLPSWLHRTLDVNPATLLFAWIQAASIWLVPIVVIWRAYIIYRVQRYEDMPAREEDNANTRLQ